MHCAESSSTLVPVVPACGRASVEQWVVLRAKQKKHRRNSAQGSNGRIYYSVRHPRDLEFPCGSLLLSVHSERTGIRSALQWRVGCVWLCFHPRMTGLGTGRWNSSGQRVGNLSIERPSCGPLIWTGGGVRTRVRLSPASISWVV
jgi:hypothetical protein